jgi:hypothetical protein
MGFLFKLKKRRPPYLSLEALFVKTLSSLNPDLSLIFHKVYLKMSLTFACYIMILSSLIVKFTMKELIVKLLRLEVRLESE